uniref:NADH-ubiquinone oxidoreductase chain 5 n=1 Tax=Scolytinae sp. BMNH 1274712 TaxID=1796543 RepID=A0A140EG38_9CUCU|nr:NADH dehydrogenase subunit 5 [Scolytinae sp. BMNH 1274712]
MVSFMFFSSMLFIFSLYLFSSSYVFMLEYELLNIYSSKVVMTILLDGMSTLFMSFVMLISSMVIYYSMGYMEGEFYLNRFIMLVFLFVLSMVFLIISPNLISILLGWDGLGLVSYCLVIYYQNFKSYNAGMLTVLSNRVGDVALMLSITWMLNYGSWNYIFYLFKDDSYMMIISFLVMLASITKSAQIPFSSWLPAAMAAPTPVSALVHSSTLVTAGVYLLIRFSEAFNNILLLILLFISSMTMFMAGLGANFEFDLKKIIALSTLSQLGLMIGFISIGESMLAFFHLLIHALFKSLLFMCAGMVIHNLGGCQDIRMMGGLIKNMPFTCCLMTISNLALCGLPFMSGFYSKDLMLEVMSMSYLNLYIYLVFYISTGLTVAYSLRMSVYVMMSNSNGFSYSSIFESSFFMLMGMLGMVMTTIFGGSLVFWFMFDSPIFICLPFMFKIFTLLVVSFGMILGVLIYGISSQYYIKFMSIYYYLAGMWNLPILSTWGINYYFLYFGHFYYSLLDQGWSEYIGAQKLYLILLDSSKMGQIFSNNNLKIYLMMFILWIMILVFMV